MKEQLEFLIEENEELKKKIHELQEENESLWFMLDEFKASRDSIGQALESMLKDKLQEQLILNMTPVGEA